MWRDHNWSKQGCAIITGPISRTVLTTIICWFDEEIILPRHQPAQASLPTFLRLELVFSLVVINEQEDHHIPGLVTSDNTIKEVPCGSTQQRGHTRSKDFAGRNPLLISISMDTCYSYDQSNTAKLKLYKNIHLFIFFFVPESIPAGTDLGSRILKPKL